MKISIITINYNNYFGLQLTLQSVCSQIKNTYYELEYIVIDGGSMDGSIELISTYDNRLDYWVSEKDRGIYHAMNKGIMKSSGDYVIFLNSGDCFVDNNVLNTYCEYAKKFSDIDIYYADTLIRNHTTGKLLRHNHPPKLSLSFFRKDTINHQASLISRKLFEIFDLYPEKYRFASDYWLYLTAFLSGKNYKHINSSLIFYDITGLSATDGFKAYSEERNMIWNDLFSNPTHISLLTNEFDRILVENEALLKNNTHKVIKNAIWLKEKIQQLKKIIKLKFG